MLIECNNVTRLIVITTIWYELCMCIFHWAWLSTSIVDRLLYLIMYIAICHRTQSANQTIMTYIQSQNKILIKLWVSKCDKLHYNACLWPRLVTDLSQCPLTHGQHVSDIVWCQLCQTSPEHVSRHINILYRQHNAPPFNGDHHLSAAPIVPLIYADRIAASSQTSHVAATHWRKAIFFIASVWRMLGKKRRQIVRQWQHNEQT